MAADPEEVLSVFCFLPSFTEFVTGFRIESRFTKKNSFSLFFFNRVTK